MQVHEDSIPSARKRTPWNKGKLIGAKPPLWPKHVWPFFPLPTKLAASAEAASGLEVRPADYISQPVWHASGEPQ
jgi:hypothetical protein